MIATLKAYWAAAKVYAFVLAVIALAFAWWLHGHRQFQAGKAAGDNEVAQLKAGYAAARTEANAAAREQQRQADEAAAADARRREAQKDAQLVILTGKLDAAQRSASEFKAKVHELKQQDPDVRSWADMPVPDGVRAAGTRGP